MRRIALIAAALVVLVACSGDPSPVAQQAPAAAAAPTTTDPKPDPGISACKASARRQAKVADSTPLPGMAERQASWERYQASRYASLREVGVKLQRAWTDGDLADQLEAGMNLVISCAAYGVEVPVG